MDIFEDNLHFPNNFFSFLHLPKIYLSSENDKSLLAISHPLVAEFFDGEQKNFELRMQALKHFHGNNFLMFCDIFIRRKKND